MKKILSIIIPCYNEEKYVHNLLNRLAEIKLDYDYEKEIIIINDGSTDQTQFIIDSFIKAHPEINITALAQVPSFINASMRLKSLGLYSRSAS